MDYQHWEGVVSVSLLKNSILRMPDLMAQDTDMIADHGVFAIGREVSENTGGFFTMTFKCDGGHLAKRDPIDRVTYSGISLNVTHGGFEPYDGNFYDYNKVARGVNRYGIH